MARQLLSRCFENPESRKNDTTMADASAIGFRHRRGTRRDGSVSLEGEKFCRLEYMDAISQLKTVLSLVQRLRGLVAALRESFTNRYNTRPMAI